MVPTARQMRQMYATMEYYPGDAVGRISLDCSRPQSMLRIFENNLVPNIEPCMIVKNSPESIVAQGRVRGTNRAWP